MGVFLNTLQSCCLLPLVATKVVATAEAADPAVVTVAKVLADLAAVAVASKLTLHQSQEKARRRRGAFLCFLPHS